MKIERRPALSTYSSFSSCSSSSLPFALVESLFDLQHF
jgi:hypothetical protein